MKRQKLNGYYAPFEAWNGWTIALISGVIGMLLASAFWRLPSKTRSGPRRLQQRDLSQLGQAPSRAHIQLSSHPARQAQPR